MGFWPFVIPHWFIAVELHIGNPLLVICIVINPQIWPWRVANSQTSDLLISVWQIRHGFWLFTETRMCCVWASSLEAYSEHTDRVRVKFQEFIVASVINENTWNVVNTLPLLKGSDLAIFQIFSILFWRLAKFQGTHSLNSSFIRNSLMDPNEIFSGSSLN